MRQTAASRIDALPSTAFPASMKALLTTSDIGCRKPCRRRHARCAAGHKARADAGARCRLPDASARCQPQPDAASLRAMPVAARCCQPPRDASRSPMLPASARCQSQRITCRALVAAMAAAFATTTYQRWMPYRDAMQSVCQCVCGAVSVDFNANCLSFGFCALPRPLIV